MTNGNGKVYDYLTAADYADYSVYPVHLHDSTDGGAPEKESRARMDCGARRERLTLLAGCALCLAGWFVWIAGTCLIIRWTLF